MIDIRKLKELIRLMVANDLEELDLRDEQQQVTIRRPGPGQEPQVIHAAPAQMMPAAPAAPAAAAPAVAAAPVAEDVDADAGTNPIESPMVGTFYSSPAPDKPAFISVGDTVTADTVVCIVEAMKIFNEIKAETEGTVEKVLAKSGDAVEFGQPLFLIRPN